ncbi:MAG: hypothetical protein ACRC2T_06135, partial [Thermoguttaceae bacterium]
MRLLFTLFLLYTFFFLFTENAVSGEANSLPQIPLNDERFIQGLVNRGLYDLAAKFCDSNIDTTDVTNRNAKSESGYDTYLTEVLYNTEKVRIYNLKSLSLPPASRKQTLLEIDKLEKSFANNVNKAKETNKIQQTALEIAELLFRFQLLVADQSLGELERLEVGISGSASHAKNILTPDTGEVRNTSPDSVVDSATTRLHQTVQRGKEINEELARLIADTKITQQQARTLFGFKRKVDFHTALAWKSLALGYPKESSELTDCINQAERLFAEIAAVPGDDPIILQSRLEKVACARLLGDFSQAENLLEALLKAKEQLPKEIVIQATAEGIRLFIAQGKIEKAMQWTVTPPNVQLPPDYELAVLEAYLANYANSEENSDELLTKALKLTEQIAVSHGKYWGRLAQITFTQSVSRAEKGNNASAFKQLAEDAYQRGNLTDAIRNYDVASEFAEKAGDTRLAFTCALAAAAVQNQLGENADLESAIKRLTVAALKWSNQPEAENAYLSAIDIAGPLVTQNRLNLAEYTEMIKAFVTTWPNSAKKNDLAIRAAKLLELQGKFEEALEICPDFPGRAKTMIALKKLVDAGKRTEAISGYKELYEKNPNDLQLVDYYGTLLADTTDTG